MTLPDWLLYWLLSPVVTIILISVVGWLARNLVLTRLKATVQYEFDAKIENIRTELRKSEETFKADLRAKEMDIHVLQSGALSGMASRQAALDKRRLEAVDQLWAMIEALMPFKAAAMILSTVKFEACLEAASKDPKVRNMFETMAHGADADPKQLASIKVYRSRPFVSELAWALFSAYQAILAHSTGQLSMLRMGLNNPGLLNTEQVTKLAKLALPHYSRYIDEHGQSGFFYMLEPLESELLKELRCIMRGEESDKESIELAAKIMEKVKIVNDAVLKATTQKPE